MKRSLEHQATGPLPSLWEKIKIRATRKPESAAILGSNRSVVTYAQLWVLMERLAAQLLQAGIGAGTRIAVVLPEGPDFLASILGVSRLSACAPINPALTAVELEAFLSALSPDALLTAPDFPIAAEVAQKLGITVFETITGADGGKTWRLVSNGRAAAGPNEDKDIAVILQTSATTGNAKLVGLTRNNLNASAESTKRALALTEADRVLLLSPLFHLQGILSAMSQLGAGGSAIAPWEFQRDEFPWWLERLKPTWYTCGPTMHRAICSILEAEAASRARGSGQRSSLRFVRSIGAPMPAELAERVTSLLGIPVLNGYGMTETGVITSMPLNDRKPNLESVGKTMSTDIRIVNASGEDASLAEEGEIVVRGANVMQGYLNDPEGNARAFFDGWFRTGDLGKMDGEGFLYVTGRLKEQINRAGEKIHPGEVDDALLLHPGVQEAATFGIPHPRLGEEVVCAIVLRPSHQVSAFELRQFAAGRLASFKVPSQFLFVDNIARGSTGKPKRHLLATQIAAQTSSTARAVQPSRPLNATEQKITALWSKLLARQDLRHDEDFFDAGGDSMGAISMLIEVEEITQLRETLSTENFFFRPTIEHLASMVHTLKEWETTESPSQSIVILPALEAVGADPARETKPPLYLFPPNSSDGTAFRRLAGLIGADTPIALVRPGHMRHRVSATVIEDAAQESADAIRAARPDGPYLLGGFCFGGAIAFETARILEQYGSKVSLVLFDTPAPGYPQFFWKPSHTAEHWKLLQEVISDARASRRSKYYAIFAARKLAWNSILLLKPLYKKFEDSRVVRWIASRAKTDDLPFIRLQKTRLPILHLLASDRPNVVSRASYLGWTQVADSFSTQHFPGNHHTFFSEGNLPGIARAVRAWLSNQDAADPNA